MSAVAEAPPPSRSGWRRWGTFAVWQAICWTLTTVQARALYGWFAVPLGAPALGWAHTLGLIVLASALSASPRPGEARVTYGAEMTARWWRFVQRMALGWVAHGIATGRWVR